MRIGRGDDLVEQLFRFAEPSRLVQVKSQKESHFDIQALHQRILSFVDGPKKAKRSLVVLNGLRNLADGGRRTRSSQYDGHAEMRAGQNRLGRSIQLVIAAEPFANGKRLFR